MLSAEHSGDVLKLWLVLEANGDSEEPEPEEEPWIILHLSE